MIREDCTKPHALVLMGSALLVILELGLSGCIIIPTPSYGGVGVIAEETIGSFEPGKTTRADILLSLGDPAERLEEDRFFLYRWERMHGVLASVVPNLQGPVPAIHYLGIEFTPDDRLKRVKMFHPWLPFTDKRSSFEEWMADRPESLHP